MKINATVDLNFELLSDEIELVVMKDGQNYVWPRYDHETRDYLNKYDNSPTKIAKYVENRGIMVQAGGNCGYYVKKFAEMFDTVYTFEPDPLNFICLTINTNLHKNVYRYQACVGDQHQMVAMATMDDQCGAMHIGKDQGLVPTMTIDDLNLPGCDLIQLDTEGFEYYGLLGAKNTIEKYHPVICIEWCAAWADRYGVQYDMIQQLITDWKYELVGKDGSDKIFKYAGQ
jgi:FkbM family methyltransferase